MHLRTPPLVYVAMPTPLVYWNDVIQIAPRIIQHHPSSDICDLVKSILQRDDSPALIVSSVPLRLPYNTTVAAIPSGVENFATMPCYNLIDVVVLMQQPPFLIVCVGVIPEHNGREIVMISAIDIKE